MKVTRSKASLSGDLTVSADLDFLTTYQVKGLASPASGEALRKGNKDITNAEIADAANIALSKLVDDYLLPVVMTARGDMVYRGATAPAKIVAGAEGKLLKMGASDPHWGDADIAYARLTVAQFQARPATGTFGYTPEEVNDNDTGSDAKANGADQYAEILFPTGAKITQWRQYGDTTNTGDGRWKLQYLNAAGVWTDWQTAIPCRTSADWSSWDSSAGEVVASGIRLVCTTNDSAGTTEIGELEVKY